MPSSEVVLIVAATRSMGIGVNGSMPWTGLRKEMQYFARVTSRPPPASSPPINAVIMGRKTWDSIPPSYRPLRNRANIVVTRDAPANNVPLPDAASPDQPLRLASYAQAIAYATRCYARVYVIGGAQIYAAALAHASPAPSRILLTSIQRDFDCDVFFPLALGTAEADAMGWRRASPEALEEWTGETVAEGGQHEAGIDYEFQMWEREHCKTSLV
ncbi:hypothetical protein CDD81_4095 [Ophiocordyceps australis]|uniref:Dihydrofolate reductase n=1 Tax=Ophiocordyceps australis TaxID=1399860 RepID=A0A2C5YCH0_9HYPO|nr:hypothetical protein CDD81_4095 [Ophiocordyceps australis]